MDDDDEDYVFCGTSLPDLNEDTILKKKSAQDLTVRDEQGRQRFHGAFTGGFSAGYFNTVGTKEGWTPSGFVSSRTNKATSSKFQQNPEDFMDNEDFGEFGIAPRTIQTTSTFHDPAADRTRKRKRVSDIDAIIPGEPPLKDLVKPVTESIGILILKKMGWRQGQGIGPRVKNKEGVKVYGCSLGPLGPPGNRMPFDDLTFAPDETPEVQYIPKDDYHGIGYSGLSMRSILGPQDEDCPVTTKSWLKKEKKQLKISGQAFGIGALEDDDDGDIYAKDDMSQYDFSEFAGQKTNKRSQYSSGTRDLPASKALEGFRAASKPFTAKKSYPLPNVPSDFQPRYTKKLMSTFEPTHHSSGTAKSKLNPTVRSLMLGEKHMPRTVTKDQQKFEQQKSKFCKASDEETPLFPPGLVGNLSAKPFSSNESKQKRYNEFVQAGCDRDYLKQIMPSSMTEWEKQQELDEFSKTASLYKPFPDSLNSRFESRSQLAMDPVAISPKPKAKEISSADISSKSHTTSAREAFEWHPTSLLCRRFNVPNPYPDSKLEGVPHSENRKTNLFDCVFVPNEGVRHKSRWDITDVKKSSDELKIETTFVEDVSEKKFEEAVKPGSSATAETASIAEKFESAPLVNQKPPMDLFKEIFKSSSSEDSENTDDDDTKQDSENTTVTSSLPQRLAGGSENFRDIDSKSNAAPAPKKEAFGVFANLDLDALNKRTPAVAKTCDGSVDNSSAEMASTQLSSTSEHLQVNKITDDAGNNASLSSDELYGPELPPATTEGISIPVVPVSRQMSHKHSKHKHKMKKRKRKKKKKKHSRKGDSSSSSDSEDEDVVVTSELILKKLKELQNPRKRRKH